MSGVKTLHCTHTFTSSHSDRLPHKSFPFSAALLQSCRAFVMVYLDTAPLAECRGSSAASIRYAMETSDDGSTVLVKAYKGETYLGRLS